jgi:glycosyltransferase involved in cell wall biosynthesis
MSETMKRQVVSMGVPGSKIVVLHNAILLEDYPTMTFTQKVREEYGIGKDEKLVAIIGRLSAEKGLDVFIEMASRISRDYQKVKFLIVGDGPLLSECMRKVADLELQGRVIFTGHRNDINDIYGAIDVLAITSSTEGLPNVLLEAFANGKPVVATKVGGIPEIVSHGTNGFLVEPGGIGELVHHVVRLLDNKNLAVEMGQNGRKTVEERLNFWDRTSKLEKVYEAIAMGRS